MKFKKGVSMEGPKVVCWWAKRSGSKPLVKEQAENIFMPFCKRLLKLSDVHENWNGSIIFRKIVQYQI